MRKKNEVVYAERQSNFELCRIVSMFMIVSVHYFPHGILDDNLVPIGTKQYYLGWLLETLCIIGPNVFTMLAAWFLCTRQKSDIRKVILIYIKLVAYNVVLFGVGLIFNTANLSRHEIILLFFPFLGGRYWYIETYILLLFLYPFINFLINNISKKSYTILLVFWICVFSLWFTILPSAPIQDWGYGITTFVTCYLIVGYIKLHGDGTAVLSKLFNSKKVCVLVYLITSGISFSMITDQTEGTKFIFPNNVAHAYCSIWVVISALSVFLLFKNLKIRYCKIINNIASLTLSVSIIHNNYSCKDLYYRIMNTEQFANSEVYILIYLSQVVLQFSISALIGWIINIPINFIWKKASFKKLEIVCEE